MKRLDFLKALGVSLMVPFVPLEGKSKQGTPGIYRDSDNRTYDATSLPNGTVLVYGVNGNVLVMRKDGARWEIPYQGNKVYGSR